MATSKSTPAKSAAIFPKVRRIAFRFGDPEPLKKHYIEGNIVLSHLVSLLSAGFPPGEESFIRSVRNYADQITDPVLKKRVAGFIGQEAMHGREHRALNDQVEEPGYPMVRLVKSIQGSLFAQNIEAVRLPITRSLISQIIQTQYQTSTIETVERVINRTMTSIQTAIAFLALALSILSLFIAVWRLG